MRSLTILFDAPGIWSGRVMPYSVQFYDAWYKQQVMPHLIPVVYTNFIIYYGAALAWKVEIKE